MSKKKAQSNRNLILHVGGPKTGSSALQDFFQFNAKTLEEIGVHYLIEPGTSASQIACVGNGMRLLDFCEGQLKPLSDAKSLLFSYFTDLNTAICSNENFFLLTADGWQSLKNLCADY